MQLDSPAFRAEYAQLLNRTAPRGGYSVEQARAVLASRRELGERGLVPMAGGDMTDAARTLRKATITTTTVGAAMLPPESSRRLGRVLQEKASFNNRLVRRSSSSGNVNKLTVGRRIIRRAVENDDDGYRVEPAFPTVPYQTKKIRLPWELTEDAIHENIEGAALETDIENEMTDAWSRDLEDLGFNGDTAAGVGPDQAFLQIDDGWLKLIAGAATAHNVNLATIDAGARTKSMFFAMANAMPNKYRLAGGLTWVMSPNGYLDYVEYLTDRDTAAGDAALGGGGDAASRPLGYPVTQVPFMPDSQILLTPASNLVRVITWDIRRRRVTGETSWDLAIKDKRGYVYFIKADHIVDDYDATVRGYGLVAP